MGFAMPRIDSDEIEHIPPEAASTYIKLAAAYGQEYYRSVADEVSDQLVPRSRLLDVGTGPGFLPVYIAMRTPTVQIDAFDFTRDMVRYGRDQANRHDVNESVSFFVANGYDIPVLDCSYSFLTCTGVLHSFEKPVAALAEFYRVLHPGGTAWVFDPTPLEPPDKLDIDLSQHERDILQTRRDRNSARDNSVTLNEAQRIATSTPFEEVEVREGEKGDCRLYLTRSE